MNKIILLGNVGKDPKALNGAASFSLAVKDGKNTQWFNVVAFKKTAELVQQYVTKGDKLLVEGKIQTSEYTDKEGNKKTSVEVVAFNVTFLTAKEGASNGWQEEADAF